jgi:hypothetical protein
VSENNVIIERLLAATAIYISPKCHT